MKTTVAAATTYPISYQQAKVHLKLDDDSERDSVESLISDATAFAEADMENTLVTRQVTAVYYRDERATKYSLPMGPVVSITSVKDKANKDVLYEQSVRGVFTFVTPTDNYDLPLTITYQAGYAVLPSDIRRALLIHVASLYISREVNVKNLGDEFLYGLRAVYNHYRRSEFVG